MSIISKLGHFLAKHKVSSVPVTVVGLDNAGKTSVLLAYSNSSKKFQETKKLIENVKPTIGKSLFTLNMGKIDFNTYDLGGQKQFRSALWSSFLRGAKGIVYVIDSSDPTRFNEVKEELWKYVLDDKSLDDIPLLILVNKIDLASPSVAHQIKNFLGFDQLKERRNYSIYSVSAFDIESILTAFRWLEIHIIANIRKQASASHE